MSLEERLRVIADLGVNAALVLPFNGGIASLTPEDFVREILVNALGAVEVVAGEDWRFGKDRTGDMDLLTALGDEMGLRAQKVRGVSYEGLSVSSTRIREALGKGDVDLVRRLLGRPHLIRGDVIHGEGRGQRLGFPTVNIPVGNVITPLRGVYAASFSCLGKAGPAAVNIGNRPTFGAGPTTVEAHLVGMEGDLYGKEIVLRFLARLRDELSFPDEASLRKQIKRDVEKAREVYRAHGRGGEGEHGREEN
jgi:riboflavin kinase/FMN adenylyltransferase